MDPLSALSLACNILAVIDFSQKLVSGTYEIYSSSTGASNENEHLGRVTEDLKALVPQLKVPIGNASSATPDEIALAALAEKCADVSDELLALLGKLQAKPNSKSASLRAGFRMMRKKGDLESLAKRIESYRGHILIRITSMMRDEQLSAGKEIKDAVHETHETSGRALDTIKETKVDVLKAIRELQTSITQAGAGRSTQPSAVRHSETNITSKMDEIRGMLTQIIGSTNRAAYEDQVLRKLEFDEMHYREDSIEKEHEKTFRWLLYDPSVEDAEEDDSSSIRSEVFHSFADSDNEDDSEDEEGSEMEQYRSSSPTSATYSEQSHETQRQRPEEPPERTKTRDLFLTWLSSGNGVFYISGKAGSGKSTLMKYLCAEEQTQQKLEVWAPGKKLVFARFFFWANGSEHQRSIQGLYRSILWKVLNACPDLVVEVFPPSTDKQRSRMPSSQFEPAVLETAFNHLINSKRILESHRLCFFIDGLDEFEGDYWKLAKQLQTWSANAGVKICVSSRPYNEFEQAFANPSQLLHLHDLTELDMQQFVEDEFSADERFLGVRNTDPRYLQLMNLVVVRAEGVFLWVRLVTRELLQGMGNAYSIIQLMKQLDTMPSGLHALFRSMFQSIGRHDRKGAARSFLLMTTPTRRTSGVALSDHPLAHSIIDDLCDESYDIGGLYHGDIGPIISGAELKRRVLIIKDRVIARCKGLVQLELRDHHGGHAIEKFEFAHRSIQEFLTDPEVKSELRVFAGSFEPTKYLCLAYLWQLKGLVPLDHDPYYSTDRGYIKGYKLDLPSVLKFSAVAMVGSIDMWQKMEICQDPFLDELDAMSQLMQKLPAALKRLEGVEVIEDLFIHSLLPEICFGQKASMDVGIGSIADVIAAPGRVFLSLASSHGIREFCISKVPECNELFGTGCLHDMLLRASIAGNRLGNSSARQLMTGLLDEGAKPNQAVTCTVTSNSGSSLTKQQWPGTVWTLYLSLTFLEGISPHVQRSGLAMYPSNFSLQVMETYLQHGADPSVLFVACFHPETDFDDSTWSTELFYLDLEQLVEALAMPARHKQPVLGLLKTRLPAPGPSSWGFSDSWFTSLLPRNMKATGSNAAISRVETEVLRTADFHVLKVLAPDQMASFDSSAAIPCIHKPEDGELALCFESCF
ncbi:hypothetical protein B0T22DRAFT_193218 [Podospora appendiculata]|uniref:NACHT domain-containing protein n=1 Tax=Podospora appendiculata TaxID=314037 RepID=A0AAE0XDA7_9PEZI|nr:hypothetical protein B0T22DRAFT_193218 [Podospora appendiculata]